MPAAGQPTGGPPQPGAAVAKCSSPYPLDFGLFDSWLPSFLLTAILFVALTCFAPAAGLPVALLSLAGIVFALWPQLKLKRADIALKHGELFAALIEEAYSDGKKSWKTSPDSAHSFYERFWALQQNQFSLWRQGLLADDTLVYWLSRRVSGLMQADTFYGKTAAHGWHDIRKMFEGTDFGAFMGALIAASHSGDDGETRRRKIERALIASMTRGKGGLRLGYVIWLYRWFAMSRPDLTADSTKRDLQTAIEKPHRFLESHASRAVTWILWIVFGSLMLLGGCNLGRHTPCDNCGGDSGGGDSGGGGSLSTTSTSTSTTSLSPSTTSTTLSIGCLPTMALCATRTFTFDRFNGSNWAPKGPPGFLRQQAIEIVRECPQASEIVVVGRADEQHFKRASGSPTRTNTELATQRAESIAGAIAAEFPKHQQPFMRKLPERGVDAKRVDVLVYRALCEGAEGGDTVHGAGD